MFTQVFTANVKTIKQSSADEVLFSKKKFRFSHKIIVVSNLMILIFDV